MNVVVLEDDHDTQALIRFNLEQAGHTVTFYDEPIALMDPALFRGGAVDCILVDLRTGVTSGVVLLRWLAHHCPEIRHIVMTGMPIDQITIALDLSDGLLAKPFTIDGLLGVLSDSTAR